MWTFIIINLYKYLLGNIYNIFIYIDKKYRQIGIINYKIINKQIKVEIITIRVIIATILDLPC